MDQQQALDSAISRGLVYLQHAQLPDGTFPTFIYPSTGTTPKSPVRPAVALTALILTALTQLPKTRTVTLCPDIASWLQTQHLYGQGFPYWAQNTPYAEDTPQGHLYTTFCALNALQQFSPPSISPTQLGNVAKILVSSEAHIGGPYAINASAQASTQERDIDLVFNCLIAHFIAEIAEPLPNVVAYIAQATGRYAFNSPHYASVYPVLYHISCAYQGVLGSTLIESLRASATDGHWDSPLATAFALLTFNKLNTTPPQTAITYLLSTQQKNGSWPGQACCNTPEGYTIGSPALTTALAVSALDAWHPKANHQPTKRPVGTPPPSDRASVIYHEVVETVNTQLQQLNAPLRGYAIATLKRIQQADTNREIGLIGYLFSQSLAHPPTRQDNALYVALGIANIYNWMAYTIYDDFLDNEGNPHLLSVANVALRYSMHYFRQALPRDTAFHNWAATLFDTVDEANAWELEECRFAIKDGSITIGHLPQYSDRARLADRSCTHSLPMAAVLACQRIPPRSAAADACYRAFRHYLIARQLNDDMHDWEEDIQRGHISFVVTRILEQLNLTPGTTIPLGELIPKMRQQFWDHTLQDICTRITDHTHQGRLAAKRSKILNKLPIIDQLLTTLDQVVERSLRERNEANEFLEGYRQIVKE